MESVNTNLQTGSDSRQLASTSPDSKSAENHVVYSRLNTCTVIYIEYYQNGQLLKKENIDVLKILIVWKHLY